MPHVHLNSHPPPPFLAHVSPREESCRVPRVYEWDGRLEDALANAELVGEQRERLVNLEPFKGGERLAVGVHLFFVGLRRK